MPNCTKCGLCCLKGGPTLHLDDLNIIKKGLLKPETLFTLRIGELAYDNLATNQNEPSIHPLEIEMIKIKPQNNEAHPWHCYFHSKVGGCTIYNSRPAQCEALDCSNSNSLDQIIKTPRLTRKDILPILAPHLVPLANAHSEECNMPKFITLISEKSQNQTAINDCINLDAAYREIAQERNLVSETLSALVFGRSFKEILHNLPPKPFTPSNHSPKPYGE